MNDAFGRRIVYLMALGLFTVGNAGCAFSSTMFLFVM